VVRDVEEERKAAGFGFPPVLGSESKTREGGRRGKRKGGGIDEKAFDMHSEVYGV